MSPWWGMVGVSTSAPYPPTEVFPMAHSHSSTSAQRAQIVALLLAFAGVYGVVTALSRRYAISRPSLYAWRARGRAALLAAFAPPPPAPATPTLARAVLTLW